jgi:hypothetical protein
MAHNNAAGAARSPDRRVEHRMHEKPQVLEEQPNGAKTAGIVSVHADGS